MEFSYFRKQPSSDAKALNRLTGLITVIRSCRLNKGIERKEKNKRKGNYVRFALSLWTSDSDKPSLVIRYPLSFAKSHTKSKNRGQSRANKYSSRKMKSAIRSLQFWEIPENYLIR